MTDILGMLNLLHSIGPGTHPMGTGGNGKIGRVTKLAKSRGNDCTRDKQAGKDESTLKDRKVNSIKTGGKRTKG